jgi:hypothetical protein
LKRPSGYGGLILAGAMVLFFLLGFWGGRATRVPPPDPDRLLDRSIATTARCIAVTNSCLDRLEIARRRECKEEPLVVTPRSSLPYGGRDGTYIGMFPPTSK